MIGRDNRTRNAGDHAIGSFSDSAALCVGLLGALATVAPWLLVLPSAQRGTLAGVTLTGLEG